MPMNALVSVIIPVYNRQAVVGECVQSVIAQSYQDFEILLVDDGSGDDSLAVCRHLAQEDSRIVVLEMEHAGVSAARNKALEAAKGDYVLFVDSDDVIHPGLMEALITGLENSDAAIAGSGIVNVREQNWYRVAEIIRQDAGPAETTYQTYPETMQAVFLGTTPVNLIGGVMMRRDWIGETRFRTDLFIGEDFYFIYENLIKGTGTVFLKQKWYYVRIHANNSSWSFGFDGFWTRFYRRRLVWRSEEALGRTENANRQKQQGLGMYWLCLRKNDPHGEDCRKMRQIMKQHRKELLSGLGLKDTILYFLSVYLPAGYLRLYRIKERIKKVKKK